MRRDIHWNGGLVFLISAAILVSSAKAEDESRTLEDHCATATPQEPETRSYSEAEWVLVEGVDYRLILCTAAGAIYLDLYETITPMTVNNFVFLAQEGYYDGTTFHRVLADFMAQGGDPTGTGRGGPGYQFADEFVGFLIFDRAGLLAMANANQPERGITGTNGSQFFITFTETRWLDHRHTIFGEVLAGMEALRSLRLCDPATCSEGDALHQAIVITDAHAVAAEMAPRAAADPAIILSAFANFFAERNITDVPYETGYWTREELLASARDMADEALQDHVLESGLEQRLTLGFETCEANYAPLRSYEGALMTFPDEASAQAALEQGYWRQKEAAGLQVAPGQMERNPSTGAVYFGEHDLCEDGLTERSWMMYRYGRALIRIEASYLREENVSGNEQHWLERAKFFYEPFFSEMIRESLWDN